MALFPLFSTQRAPWPAFCEESETKRGIKAKKCHSAVGYGRRTLAIIGHNLLLRYAGLLQYKMRADFCHFGTSGSFTVNLGTLPTGLDWASHRAPSIGIPLLTPVSDPDQVCGTQISDGVPKETDIQAKAKRLTAGSLEKVVRVCACVYFVTPYKSNF